MWSRIRERHSALYVGGALTIVFVVLGGLTWAWGVAGLIGVGIWVIAWPDSVTGPAAAARSDTDLPSEPGHGNGGNVGNDTSVWEQIIGAAPDSVLMLDRRLRILAANPNALALFPGAIGLTIAHVQRSPELLSAVENAHRTGSAQTFELRMSVPVERHLAGTATSVGPHGGDSTASTSQPALLVVLRDRTEQESLAQMHADFVANASHELRTPLASLKGFVETLQGAAKDDPVARERFLDIMQREANRMSQLIEDLLSLSRIEMREHVAPNETVDLVEIVESVGRMIEPLAAREKRSVDVVAHVRPARVVGDRDELAQVAQNLMQNAIKYGREGGQVRVSVRREGSRIGLVVADDGIGIAREHLPRLTERFYRVSAKESRERGGTGLGLAIVKHIVNRHRGELRIESQLGKGSTFIVLLPPAADHFPQARSTGEAGRSAQ